MSYFFYKRLLSTIILHLTGSCPKIPSALLSQLPLIVPDYFTSYSARISYIKMVFNMNVLLIFDKE